MANDRQGFIDESEEATPLKGGKAKDAAAAGDGGTAAANGSGGGEGWLLQRLGLRHLASRLRGAHQPPSRGDEGGGGQQQHHPRQQQRRRSRLLLEQLAGWANCTKKWSPPRMPKVPKRAERQIRLLGPLLLPLSLAVYLLLGAAAFLFLEHTNHEQTVRKWFFNLIVNRHKFARQISSAIFNGTRNMLVIVDYDSSERIQRDLVHLLSQYEQHLELRVPDLNEWTLLNSLCYCWGLLTTIGHGHRAPKTGAGQVFSLFYCLLGVPFFVITLIVVSHRLFLLCGTGFQLFVSKKRASLLANHRLLLLLLLCSLYGLWLLLFALLLFAYAIPESFWRSLYTAVLASLTIQSADYNALSEPQKLLTLGGASISLQLACICIFSMTGLWRYGRGATAGGQRRGTTEGGGGGMQQRPKFKVVVNEVGSTKLAASVSAPNSPPTENGSSHGNGAGKRGQQQPK